MRTIALETSAQPGELALLEGREILYETALPADRRTTDSFAGEIQQAFQRVGWRPADVELFAISEGPGSFTGLRIGVTAAKTFAYATGCQVVAVNTLELLAVQAQLEGPVWSILDAQRQQLFIAQFGRTDGRWSEQQSTQIVAAHDWLARLPQAEWLTGAGLRGWLQQLPAHVQLTPEACWTARARQLALTAQDHQADGRAADIWKLAPRYYRQSAAEEKLQHGGPTSE